MKNRTSKLFFTILVIFTFLLPANTVVANVTFELKVKEVMEELREWFSSGWKVWTKEQKNDLKENIPRLVTYFLRMSTQLDILADRLDNLSIDFSLSGDPEYLERLRKQRTACEKYQNRDTPIRGEDSFNYDAFRQNCQVRYSRVIDMDERLTLIRDDIQKTGKLLGEIVALTNKIDVHWAVENVKLSQRIFDTIGSRSVALAELELIFYNSNREQTLSASDIWGLVVRLREISSKTKTVALEMADVVLNASPPTE